MSNKALYTTVCEAHPEMPVFAQAWWLDAVCGIWDAAVATQKDHIKGVWAYPIEAKMGVVLLRNPKLTPYFGPSVFPTNPIKKSNIDSYEQDTIAELLKQLPAAQVWNIALPPGIQQAGTFKKHGLTLLVQQTFLIDLSEDEATLLSNMKEGQRQNVRLSEREVTISNDPSQIDELYHFHEQTLKNKGRRLPYLLADVRKLMDACLAHDATALWVAKEGDTIHAILWQVWDGARSYNFMAAQNPASGNYKALSGLIWHAIKYSKQRGHQIFDMEGSMDEGVERFFRSFCGKRTLYMVLKKNSSLPWKIKEMIRG